MKRAIISFDRELHEVLRLRSLQSNRSISELVDEAVRLMLAEDLEDLVDLTYRVSEPRFTFEAFIEDLTKRGKL